MVPCVDAHGATGRCGLRGQLEEVGEPSRRAGGTEKGGQRSGEDGSRGCRCPRAGHLVQGGDNPSQHEFAIDAERADVDAGLAIDEVPRCGEVPCRSDTTGTTGSRSMSGYSSVRCAANRYHRLCLGRQYGDPSQVADWTVIRCAARAGPCWPAGRADSGRRPAVPRRTRRLRGPGDPATAPG